MLLLSALALVVPFLCDFYELRDFYELTTPTSETVVAWAVGIAIGLGGMLAALRLLHHRGTL